MTMFRSLWLAVLFLLLQLLQPLYAEPVVVADPRTARQEMVAAALSYLGTPYLYGGIDEKGLDCSGFIYQVMLKSLGIAVPRTSIALFRWTESVSLAQLDAGDLLFFNTTGTVSHVGLYIGENRFVHSASEGQETGVIISSLDEPYWKTHFVGAGRVVASAPLRRITLAFGSLAQLGPSSNPSFVYGGESYISATFKIPMGTYSIEPGVEIRCLWNYYSGTVLFPVTLSIGVVPALRLFAGWPGLIGLGWEPFSWNIKKGPLAGGTLSIKGEAFIFYAEGGLNGAFSAGLQYRLD
ncbi:MAG: C40 family peptidase [Treponema sp.]|nr:C40 family peptidase [Treponema sp.]